MLPKSIRDMVLEKIGKETIYSADCPYLASKIGLSESTIKRMFGLVGKDSEERFRTPHQSTMDILSRWLGYADYNELLKELGEGNFSSDFTPMESIDVAALTEGTQIQLRYEPARVIVMTYLGNGEFLINESKNSKLLKGDRIKLTHLVREQELIASEVIRDGHSLGGYQAARDGGLTSLEIVT